MEYQIVKYAFNRKTFSKIQDLFYIKKIKLKIRKIIKKHKQETPH